MPKILRPGAVTEEVIRQSTSLQVGVALSMTGEFVDGEGIRVSGSIDSHYAPVDIVVLDKSTIAGQGFIAMEDVGTPHGVVRLAAPKSDEEFARV